MQQRCDLSQSSEGLAYRIVQRIVNPQPDAMSPAPTLPFVADETGMPLPASVLAHMEAFFGTDLSAVRIHIGAQALAMGCHAFAFGDHIYFAPGMFDPSSFEGLRMLAHELTHVLQQRCGRAVAAVPGQPAVLDDRLLEVEADLLGDCAARFDGRRGATMRVAPDGRFYPSRRAGVGFDDFQLFQRWAQSHGMHAGVIQRVITMPKWWSATKAVLVEKFIEARSKTDALPGMLTLYHGTDDTFRSSVTGYTGSATEEQAWVTAFFQKKVTSNAKCGPGIYGADNLTETTSYGSSVMKATQTELAKSRYVDLTGSGHYKGTGIAAQDAFAYAYKCIIRYTHNYYAVKDYRVVWVNQ
jgi:hypothetical protein